MGAELAQGGIGEQHGRGHIKDSLWIIAGPENQRVVKAPPFCAPIAGRAETALALAQQVPGHSCANSQSAWNRHSLMPLRPLATTACNSRILFLFWVSSVSISCSALT